VQVELVIGFQTLEGCGVRFIAITQGLDTDQQNPASRFLLHVLGAAAEFELKNSATSWGHSSAKRRNEATPIYRQPKLETTQKSPPRKQHGPNRTEPAS
jgi:DNA invertase Pin-like site-specific DNA recombinase